MFNGKQSIIAHIGLIHLTPSLSPSNILHVLDFQFNILSVSKLCNQIAGKVIFTSTNCTLKGPMSQEVVVGKGSSALYHVQHVKTRKFTAANGSMLM